jgi:hypothetical protein
MQQIMWQSAVFFKPMPSLRRGGQATHPRCPHSGKQDEAVQFYA